MFEYLSPNPQRRLDRARFRWSIIAALAIYGSAASVIIAASAIAKARKAVEEPKETRVDFVLPPEAIPMPSPASTPKLTARPRPRAKLGKRESERPKGLVHELPPSPALPPPPEEMPAEVVEQSHPPPAVSPVADGAKQLPTEPPKDSYAPPPMTAESRAYGTRMQGGFRDGILGGTGTVSTRRGLSMPVALSGNPKPIYPPVAISKRIEGTVFVRFDVLEDGKVGNLMILDGPFELRESVVSALSLWLFTPATLDGKPIRIRAMHRVDFELTGVRVH